MAGDFGTSSLGTILNGLKSLFGIFRGASLASVKIALFNLRDGLLEVGEGLGNFVEETRSFFSGLVGLFRRFYASGLLPLLKWLRDKFLALQAWLKRVFKPLFDFLLRIRRELLHFYTRFVRPVLDVIEAVRFGLQLLGRLGVEWAQELDRKLGKLADSIDSRFRQVLGKLNSALDFLDLIADPFSGLLRRVPFLGALKRDVAVVWRVLVNSRIGSSSPGGSPPPTIEEVKRDTEVALLTGGGRYGPVIAEMGALWRQYLNVR